MARTGRRRIGRYIHALRIRLAVRDRVLIFAAPDHVIPRDDSPLVVRRADHLSIADLSWFEDARRLATFEQFIRAGHTGYLVYADDRCVHRSWLVPGPAQIREHFSTTATIGPHEAFLHYCRTAPTARGMGAFPLVLRQVVRDNPGVRIRMAVASDNRASQMAAEKAGWTVVEVVVFYVFAGIHWQSRHRVQPS